MTLASSEICVAVHIITWKYMVYSIRGLHRLEKQALHANQLLIVEKICGHKVLVQA